MNSSESHDLNVVYDENVLFSPPNHQKNHLGVSTCNQENLDHGGMPSSDARISDSVSETRPRRNQEADGLVGTTEMVFFTSYAACKFITMTPYNIIRGVTYQYGCNVQDMGYFMNPGDRSYDALGLMHQLREHSAAADNSSEVNDQYSGSKLARGGGMFLISVNVAHLEREQRAGGLRLEFQ
ncbi:hypothetical protein C5167_047964 [Papaver somniferum]|uniref:Uncharacterized protein n=1 Tax=Papaver somniferum TaxID=3469 RepID=A0A4Y7KKR7_PAPSO|nr:hypothetical protein C5167_047964 [Papaver somniferum]